MKLAFITPTAYLNRFSKQGDIYLALAHLIDDDGHNEYSRFHRREAEQGRRVILDNGLFEGSQVSTEQLLQRARAIKASCVCAPDVLYDSKGTIKEFKRFIKARDEFGLVAEIMGIPQASNPTDWWECYQFMDLHPECSIVGLSILSIPESFRTVAKYADRWPITASRMHVIRQLYSFSHLAGRRITPCHLLGLGEHFGDIISAKRYMGRDIVSNDSSSAFVHGYNDVQYTGIGSIPGGKIKEKLDFSIDSLNETQDELIQNNIDIAKHIAGKEWF